MAPMNNNFHKIASFLMALLVLFSTFSFTVDKHFCGNTLVDTAVFGKGSTCVMEMPNSSFTSDDCSIASKNCCHDEKVLVCGQDDLIMSYIELSFQQQLFVSSFVYRYINLFKGIDEIVTPLDDYSPPILVKNLHILNETFLI